MKRVGHLWDQITSFDNLFLAAHRASKRKRFKSYVLEFNFDIERELINIQNQLLERSYVPGDYRTFEIFEPKRRMISAAPFRDRVVHHALCNVIQPIFEKSFISDSYANRTGYGTHRALRRFTEFARSSKYVLQCDIQRYFPSIDHEILKQLMRRKIKCRDTLWLLDTIIENSNEQEPRNIYFEGDDLFTPFERRRGLPIGNLTSQFFANVYLNGLDHFVRENLRIGKYVRYVDDFSLFHNDRRVLEEARVEIENFLTQFRLQIHKVKSQLFETRIGANFVGFRVLPDTIRVRSDNLRRARWRLRKMQSEFDEGSLEVDKLKDRLCSWIAHLKHGDTFQLRSSVFSDLVFSRS